MKDFLYTNEWFHRNPVRFSVCKVSHHLLICIRFKCATWKQVHKLKSYASIVVILVINKHSCYSVMQIVAKLWYFLSQHTNRSVQYGWTDLYIKNIGWPRDTAVQISWWLDKICRWKKKPTQNGWVLVLRMTQQPAHQTLSTTIRGINRKKNQDYIMSSSKVISSGGNRWIIEPIRSEFLTGTHVWNFVCHVMDELSHIFKKKKSAKHVFLFVCFVFQVDLVMLWSNFVVNGQKD